jgi:hypothetical protein
MPVLHPKAFGDVIHMDIVFGPDIALGMFIMVSYLQVDLVG